MNTTFHTKDFSLVPIKASDIHNIYEGLSDPEVTQYYDVHFSTLEATQEQMLWYDTLQKEGTGIWWGIHQNQTHEFLGAVGFNNLNATHRRAEIGFWLLKRHWGKGIFKTLMPKLFEIGFTTLQLHRIEAYVLDTNTKCKRALSKTNFTFEGLLRDYEIKKGSPISIAIYSVLKSEWSKPSKQL
jgi:ribosomal-protein-alanine N-acetyltransferase